MKKLKMARTGYLIMSLVFYISGAIYMVLPEVSPLGICIVSGIASIVYGVIKIIGYFSKDLYCLAFQYDLACGLFLIVLGIILLARSQRLIPYLSVGLGALVLLDSLLSIQMAKDAKQFGLETWNVILTASILTGVLSVFMIADPLSTRMGRHIVAGGTLLAEGFKNQCVVRYTVSTMETRFSEEDP